MLSLLRSFPGVPARTPPLSLPLSSSNLIVYASGDTVVLLDALDLSHVRILPFWEAFPGTFGSKGKISFVSVDKTTKRIIAVLGTQIGIWSLSSNKITWRIHSTLTLSEHIASLDLRSSKLVIGSSSGLSIYKLSEENDLPTWTKEWSTRIAEPVQCILSPNLSCVAVTSKLERVVRIYSCSTHRQIQKIKHPLPISNIAWRIPPPKYPDDIALYTITSDSTLRIFLPVLDAPTRLQLHASLDKHRFLTASNQRSLNSRIFLLDRDIFKADQMHYGDSAIGHAREGSVSDEGRRQRLKDVVSEGWDMFAGILDDGSVVVRALANVDRRPPTLLQQFTILQSPPQTLPPSTLHLSLNPALAPSHHPSLFTSPPLQSFSISPLLLFDAHPNGLQLNNILAGGINEEKICAFYRTPEGEAVGAVREGNGGELWIRERWKEELRLGGVWEENGVIAVFNQGRSVAIYSIETSTLTVRHYNPFDEQGAISPSVATSLSLSLSVIPQLFSLPQSGTRTPLLVITPTTLALFHFDSTAPNPVLTQHSISSLPLPKPPLIIMPVDPMAWSRSLPQILLSQEDFYMAESAGKREDVLVSISDIGELAFWVPDISGEGSKISWRCTGKINTGRKSIGMARCSSAKKTVLVVKEPSEQGQELTIWDSKESEFSSGLEYRNVFSEDINDLDWTSTDDSQSILAVGFAHRVVLLCQQRMTYFDQEATWGIFGQVDISDLTPHPINDSVWLAGGTFLMSSGHQMFLYGKPRKSLEDDDEDQDVFEMVARHNGPLPDYHPQMLLQCLLWDKLELVKEIIVRLSKALEDTKLPRRKSFDVQRLDVSEFLRGTAQAQPTVAQKPQYPQLFDEPSHEEETENESGFSRKLVEAVEAKLDEDPSPLPNLTPNERAHLIVLIQTTLEVDEQRRALDAEGLRYLISMRSFYILNERIGKQNGMATPASHSSHTERLNRRQRIRYRDMIWAFHSQSQDLLLSASAEACGGKMLWPDARSLGVFLWLQSTETLKSQFEVIARNHYMAGDDRDPTACCLYYFALGKSKLVHGLWKQAAWHKEQNVMLKFLSNDFTQARWRTAALKNAFALLSKQRYEYATAFFLLGNSLRDAVNVCLKQQGDFQLAIALVRIIEGDDSEVLKDILTKTVVPLAFKEGNRWLGSWAFWMLKRRDLAVRILLTPLNDIAATLDIRIDEIGDPHYDDPSLGLLFSQLKAKSLQTAKGTSEISGRTEFNFVLQLARVFCRMGCHVLALDLVKNWSFDRMAPQGTTKAIYPHFADSASEADSDIVPSSPRTRRSYLRRRSSVIIDMDIPSSKMVSGVSPALKSSDLPETVIEEEGNGEDPEVKKRKEGLGSLLQNAKRDVTVPEFDMGAFF